MHTSATIVRALRTGETTFGPTIWRTICIEEGIFLLETEPWHLIFGKLHGFVSVMAVVCPVRSAIVVVGLGEDEDVVAPSEGVFKDGGGTKVYI